MSLVPVYRVWEFAASGALSLRDPVRIQYINTSDEPVNKIKIFRHESSKLPYRSAFLLYSAKEGFR
jgi:hypothetical protein